MCQELQQLEKKRRDAVEINNSKQLKVVTQGGELLLADTFNQ
jgi:hypothetical protein